MSGCPAGRSSPATVGGARTAGGRPRPSTTSFPGRGAACTPGRTWSPPAPSATTARVTRRRPSWAGVFIRYRRPRAEWPGACSATARPTRAGPTGWICRPRPAPRRPETLVSGLLALHQGREHDHVVGVALAAAEPVASAGDQAQSRAAVVAVDAIDRQLALPVVLDRVDLEHGHLVIPAQDLDAVAVLHVAEAVEDRPAPAGVDVPDD